MNHEGDRLPADVGPQGRKIQTVGPPEADFPSAVPSGESSTCEQPVRLPARAAARISTWLRSGAVSSLHAAAKSFRNLSRVHVLHVDDVGVADLVGAATLVLSQAALDALTARARKEAKA